MRERMRMRMRVVVDLAPGLPHSVANSFLNPHAGKLTV
jgi:hypothetical protein